jgi:hypothetical protein
MRNVKKFGSLSAVIIQQALKLSEIISYCIFLDLCLLVVSRGLAKLNASFLLRCHENCARFFSCNAPALSADRNKKVAQKIPGIRLPWNVFAMPGPVNKGKNPFRVRK